MEKEIKSLAENLLDFIDESPTAFHAVAAAKKELLSAGFSELKEEEAWKIEKGGKYFTTRNDSSLFGFVVGTGEMEAEGFRIAGSHTDSPTFRIKPHAEMCNEGFLKLNTEVYGVPILNTWFDRPLSIAGRVAVKSTGMFPESRLVNISRPITIIPNLAIHLNRKVNHGVELNPQKDTIPMVGCINDELEKDEFLVKLIAGELGVKAEDILDFDLFLYEYGRGCLLGVNEEFISSSRIDNLSMVHSAIHAILDAKPGKATNLIACFDNEEVGSSTKQGANSEILVHTLERIALSLGKGREELLRAYAKSFMISTDAAQGLHPNNTEKFDPTCRVILNQGPAIKISAAQSYTSDSISIGTYEMICEKAKVPVQKFVNRSDEPGGRTIGPLSATHLPIKSVDIGAPLLAMHSVRELGGVYDHFYITKSLIEFFSM
ncbi:M18 family aminopeptidase [Clostridium sp. 19966]|uniref:M18 family aminopeptidase n=1 Tax=Clostridium sp. 19966 TaxID=2768166 RepID=UPI0028E00891|nr:M18 family aminopeptidase [Clostridium sp. 19966]MDT8718702.1 M18 family aminopeptidase [Clostridium sp. 19966]